MRIDLRLFSLGSIGHLGLLYYNFFFFSNFSSKFFFLAFFFLLESPNILLSRINYGAKFNFIGIKKTEGVHNFF